MLSDGIQQDSEVRTQDQYQGMTTPTFIVSKPVALAVALARVLNRVPIVLCLMHSVACAYCAPYVKHYLHWY